MLRKIIHIDEEKCTGCGLCANACHEGAIDIVNGKAKLMRENFCDGFGDCLPGCPTGAITFEEREAPEYDHAAVMQAKAAKEQAAENQPAKEHTTESQTAKKTDGFAALFGKMRSSAGDCQDELPAGQAHKATAHQCPGSMMRQIRHENSAPAALQAAPIESELTNWPVQIKLAPIKAPYFDKAKLLIAADCTAYSYAAFHQDFIRGRVALVGCPKLDAVDYSEKLTEIIRSNDITSVTIVRMEVPCCGGLERAAKKALQDSGKFIPWQVVTISIDGKILDR